MCGHLPIGYVFSAGDNPEVRIDGTISATSSPRYVREFVCADEKCHDQAFSWILHCGNGPAHYSALKVRAVKVKPPSILPDSPPGSLSM